MSQLGIPEDFFECSLFKKNLIVIFIQFSFSFRLIYCQACLDRYIRVFRAGRSKW